MGGPAGKNCRREKTMRQMAKACRCFAMCEVTGTKSALGEFAFTFESAMSSDKLLRRFYYALKAVVTNATSIRDSAE